MKRALITGITGQDGSYLAEFLAGKGYEIHGLIRRASGNNMSRLDGLSVGDDRLHMHYGDLTDSASLGRLILELEPDEVYNLASQSDVRVSFEQPIYSVDVAGLGTLRVLEAIRQLSPRKSVKFFQACSSEMYGNCEQCPQNEQTPFHPTSPYACAKVYAFHQTVNYRETYELFACNGILFNHESPRRGENFVTRKVSRAVTRIREGLQQVLKLGNVRAQRDWGYAPDYVDAMWRMLQRDSPRDYVVATGEVHTVEALARLAFASVQLDYDQYVRIDPRLLRPAEGTLRRGDATRAHEELGWQPTTTFTQLIAIMVAADWELARQERALRGVVAGSEET